MKAVLDHIEVESPNISTYYFQTEEQIDYIAGQAIELIINHPEPDNRGIKRWFTLSSSPSDKLISITTKLARIKSSSYMLALRRLKIGDAIDFSEPSGNFVLPSDDETPLIFVAGGIGITPFHSILTWLESNRKSRPIKLLYAVNNEDEIIFKPLLARLGLDVSIAVSSASKSWNGIRGRLTPELIINVEKYSAGTLIYMSGPAGMIKDLENGLARVGIEKNQIILDEFPGYNSLQDI
jgi:ferredoxin-NADP reductase